MSKKKIVISGILLILIVALLGVAYAYLRGNIEGIGGKVTATTKNLNLTFNDNNLVEASNINPGWSVTKVVTITNNTSNATMYNLVWKTITNRFLDKSDLVYSVTCTGTNCKSLSETEVPWSGKNQIILYDIIILGNQTQTYTINIRFKETNKNQYLNDSASLYGRIGLSSTSNKDLIRFNETTERKISSFYRNNIYNSTTRLLSSSFIELEPGSYKLDFDGAYYYAPIIYDTNENFDQNSTELISQNGGFIIKNNIFTITKPSKVKFMYAKNNFSSTILPSELLNVKLYKLSSISTYESIDTSIYATNSLGYKVLNNNTIYQKDPTFNLNAVSQSVYDSLPDTLDQTIPANNGNIPKSLATYLENGLFKVVGSDGFYSYVLRGSVNDYVSFANSLWKIIRINEDGTIRLLRQSGVFYASSNDGSNNRYYVINDNNEIKDSELKGKIDNWYENNLLDYDEFISNTTFCNDQTLYGYYRYNDNNPTLACKSYGNRLKISFADKVGLVTSDELIYAGLAYNGYHTSFRLILNNCYSMTMGNAASHTLFTSINVNSTYSKNLIVSSTSSVYIYPVISLNKDVVVSSGDGTSANPYVINTN